MSALLAQQTAVPRVRTRRLDSAILLGAVGAVVGVLGAWVPSYWGDEAASVMSATRPWPSLGAELSTIDGVHGLYYSVLHLWMQLFGSSELATRSLSAIGVGFMVAGTVVLVRQFGSPRLAVLSGIVAIVLPRTTWMAVEARSYALGAAAAVWLTVLLVVLIRRRASTRWWLVYGVAMAAGVYLFLYLALLLAVHASYLLLRERAALRTWLRAAGVALVVASPIIVIGVRQREQIEFLARRDYATLRSVLVRQWFGSIPIAVFCWALVVLAVASLLISARRRGLIVLALGWLVVPTAAVLIGNATIAPLYNMRYLTFSTPAAAILVAVGISAVARSVTRPAARPLLTVLLTGILVALCLPGYLAQRGPFAKDGGSDLRQVAAYIGDNARPGDAIVFDQSTKPSRDPRLALRLYPADFTAVRDVALVTPFFETTGLWDKVAPIEDTGALLTRTRDVWAVELGAEPTDSSDVTYLQSRGYELVATALVHRTTIYHLIKE